MLDGNELLEKIEELKSEVYWDVNVNLDKLFIPDEWENICITIQEPNGTRYDRHRKYFIYQHWKNTFLRIFSMSKNYQEQVYLVEYRLTAMGVNAALKTEWICGNHLNIVEKLKIKSYVNKRSKKHRDFKTVKNCWYGGKEKLTVNHGTGYKLISLKKYMFSDKSREFYHLSVYNKNDILIDIEDLNRNKYLFTENEYNDLKGKVSA
jgi:hypothetical protein